MSDSYVKSGCFLVRQEKKQTSPIKFDGLICFSHSVTEDYSPSLFNFLDLILFCRINRFIVMQFTRFLVMFVHGINFSFKFF